MNETPITLEMSQLLVKENQALREKVFQLSLLVERQKRRLCELTMQATQEVNHESVHHVAGH